MGKFIPNPEAIELLKRTPEMVAMLYERATKAAESAKEIAPVDTGAYRDSIEPEAGIENGEAKGRVNAKDFKAGWIEFGTSRWYPAHATLRRGAESSGLRLTSKGRTFS